MNEQPDDEIDALQLGGVYIAVSWLVLCSALWSLGGLTNEFLSVVLLGFALGVLLLAGFILCLVCVISCIWRRKEYRPRQFWVSLLSMPLALAFLLPTAVFGRSVAQFFQTGSIVSAVDDPDFRAMVDSGADEFEFDGHTVMVDRTRGTVRYAFDVDGYVVRASGYVVDPTHAVPIKNDGEVRWFNYFISRCRHIRADVFDCSFT